MIEFQVQGMSCGRCVTSIERAIGAVDRDARVTVDQTMQRVRITGATAPTDVLAAVLAAQGYPARQSVREVVSAGRLTAGGCCAKVRCC